MRRFGGPDVLEVADLPMPEPGPGEILLRLHACGVCYHDVVNRSGALPRTPLPCVVGHELVGEVAALGAGVTGVDPGARVVCLQRMPCGRCRHCRDGREHLCDGPMFGEDVPGGYAEYAVVRPGSFVPLPDAIAPADAGTLTCGVATALHAVRRGRVAAGETVLITGGSGGIGIHAIQVARLAGARVLAVTSSEAKADRLRSYGAEPVVSPDGRFHPAVRRLVPEGVDCVLEITGAPTLGASLRSVQVGGRVVVVGNVAPGDAAVNPGLLIMKEIDLISARANTLGELREAVDLVAGGRVRPVVSRVLPLEQAAEAHRLLGERRAVGRVVLLMDDPDRGHRDRAAEEAVARRHACD